MKRGMEMKIAKGLRKMTLALENAQARSVASSVKTPKKAAGRRQRRASSQFNAEAADVLARKLLSVVNNKKELDAEIEEVTTSMTKRVVGLADNAKSLRDEYRKSMDPAADRMMDLHGILLRYAAHERALDSDYEIGMSDVQLRMAMTLGTDILQSASQIVSEVEECLAQTQHVLTQLEMLDVAAATGKNRTAGILGSLVEALQSIAPLLDKTFAIFKLGKKRVTDNATAMKANIEKLMALQDEAVDALEV